MNLNERGTTIGPRKIGLRRAYDERPGASFLRRIDKSGTSTVPLRGDQPSTLLAARRKKEVDDRVNGELRDYYQSVLRAPVPERLVSVVDALFSETH
jgi:hypothetical protein